MANLLPPADKLFLHKVFDFFLTFLVWAVVGLFIHEAGHDLGATLLGYPISWIDLNWPALSGTHYIQGAPPAGSFDALVWALSGGLFTALIMGLLWWRAWASPCRWDLDDEATLAILGVGQVFYGVSEAIPWGWSSYLFFPGLLLGFAFYLPKVAKWMASGETH